MSGVSKYKYQVTRMEYLYQVRLEFTLHSSRYLCTSRRDDVDGRFGNWNSGLECRQDDCERPRGSRNESSIGGRCDERGEKAIAPRLLNESIGSDEILVVL